jgi:hypothetical protein
MKQIMIVFLIVSSILFITNLTAATIEVTEGVYTPFTTGIINSQVNDLAADLNDEKMIKLAGNQDELAQATNYSNSGLYLQGAHYSSVETDYALITVGTGLGAENAPGLSEFQSSIEDGKDSYAGVSAGGIVGSVTATSDNLEFVPIKGLMINFMSGALALDKIMGMDLSYSSFLIGGGLKYRILENTTQGETFEFKNVVAGIGAYHVSNTTVYVPDNLKKESDPSNGIYTKSDTALEFEITSLTTTIPVEVTTTSRVGGFFTLIGGTGVDFTFGETRIDVTGDTNINAYDENDIEIETDNPAKMKLKNSNTTYSDPNIRYKVIAGLGFNFEPVKLEIPVVYYPAAGTTVSVVLGAGF